VTSAAKKQAGKC